MSWSITLSPLIPQTLFWPAVAVAILLASILLWRRRRGAVLRVACLAALLGALANPTLEQEDREYLPNIALVMIDESGSQTIAGRAAQSRAIVEDIKARLKRIPNLEVRWLTSSRPGEKANSGTQLFRDLNRALANIPPDRLAGVFMVTDGQVHDVPKRAEALGFDAPVHALLTGAKGEFDRRIEVLKAPRYGLVGSTRMVELKVRESGAKRRGDGMVSLRIRREGQPEARRRVRIGQLVKIPFGFPHAGQNIVEIDLEPIPGELTAANNRIVVTAQGVRENLRVLLVSGAPHAGERTWRNLLKSDAAVDLVHFTILRPPHKQDGTPIHQLSLIAFPTRELFSEKIKDFDLIIFDRYNIRGILPPIYFDNISRYITEHGGALLVAAGSDFASQRSLYRTPLRSIMPAIPSGRVIERGYKARISKIGKMHPVTRALPGSGGADPKWGRWFRLIDAQPERGHVVMTGPRKRPLLVLDRYGKGRVALLLSDHAWLWARGFEGGGPHTALLRRLAHWLMKEPDLEEERLIAKAKGLQITIERRSMLKTVPEVSVLSPNGETQQVTLEKAKAGRWRATLAVKQPGLYKLRSGKLTAVTHVGIGDPREMSEVTTTDQHMAKIMGATGGGAFWTRKTAAKTTTPKPDVALPRITMLRSAKILHGSNWLGLKDREAYVTRGVTLTPMYAGFGALGILLALLAVTWWREGQ